MQGNNINNVKDINILVYHDQSLVAKCKVHHLGFMGIYLQDTHLGYPVGTPVEIAFPANDNRYCLDNKLSMVINKINHNGTGLQLKNYEGHVIRNWMKILENIQPKYFPITVNDSHLLKRV